MQNSVVDLTQAEGEPEHLLRSQVGGYLSDLEKDRLLRPGVLTWVAATLHAQQRVTRGSCHRWLRDAVLKLAAV